jgi:uncharacterized protein
MYIAQARSFGYKVYVGTLLPMGGWRTDAPFRQEMRHAYNEFIRTTDLIDGCIDFDKALRDPENPDYFLLEDDKLDIDELLETNFILDMDSRYLCKEDCKGLCSRCGADLNEGSCSCTREKDPRLAVLEQLLDDKE